MKESLALKEPLSAVDRYLLPTSMKSTMLLLMHERTRMRKSRSFPSIALTRVRLDYVSRNGRGRATRCEINGGTEQRTA